MFQNSNSEKPKVLEYGKGVTVAAAIFKFLSFLSFLHFLISIGINLFLVWRGKASEVWIFNLFAFGGAWLFFYLQYRLFYKPLATRKILVFNDRYLIRQEKKETAVPYSEITEIDAKGSWFTLILKSGNKHKFTAALERSDIILDAVIVYHPRLMDREKYLDFRTQLILIDHGSERFYDLFGSKYLWITLSHALILPFGFMIYLFDQQSRYLVINDSFSFYNESAANLYFFMLIYRLFAKHTINKVIDQTIHQRLLKDPTNKARDLELESSIYRKVFPAYLAGLVVLFAVFFHYDLNTLSFTSADTDFPLMNMQSGEWMWVDKKFNTLKGQYALRNQDRVLYIINGKEFLGQIVAVPGESIEINDKNEKGRFIASTHAVTVPEDKIAVQANPEGSLVKLVNIEKVNGLLFSDLSDFLNPIDARNIKSSD